MFENNVAVPNCSPVQAGDVFSFNDVNIPMQRSLSSPGKAFRLVEHPRRHSSDMGSPPRSAMKYGVPPRKRSNSDGNIPVLGGSGFPPELDLSACEELAAPPTICLQRTNVRRTQSQFAAPPSVQRPTIRRSHSQFAAPPSVQRPTIRRALSQLAAPSPAIPRTKRSQSQFTQSCMAVTMVDPRTRGGSFQPSFATPRRPTANPRSSPAPWRHRAPMAGIPMAGMLDCPTTPMMPRF